MKEARMIGHAQRFWNRKREERRAMQASHDETREVAVKRLADFASRHGRAAIDRTKRSS